MHVIKKIDLVVGPVYFDQDGNTVFEIAVAGMATVADGKAEAKAKRVTLERNATLDFDALYTMQERQMVEQLSAVYAPPSEQPLNEAAANAYWRGTVERDFYRFDSSENTWVLREDLKEEYAAWKAFKLSNYAATRKQSNGVNCFDIAITGPEQLVFKTEKDGARTVRLWLNRDTNASARIRYIPSRVSWLLEVYISRRDGTGRWWNNKQAEHYVHRTVTEESELTVAKYVALYFAKAQASH